MENLYRFLLRSPALQLCQRSCRSGEAERAMEMFRYQCICMSCDQNIVTVLSADFNSFFLSLRSQ